MDKNVEKFVNEYLASHGRRELSMDEADQVVGGSVPGVFVDDRYYTADTINSLAFNMTDIYGFDVAFDVFCKKFKFSPNEKPQNGNATDHEKMGVVLNQYWKAMERTVNGGKSY